MFLWQTWQVVTQCIMTTGTCILGVRHLGMFTDLTVFSKLIKGYKRDSISCEFVGYWEAMKIICLVKEQDIKTRHAIQIPSWTWWLICVASAKNGRIKLTFFQSLENAYRTIRNDYASGLEDSCFIGNVPQISSFRFGAKNWGRKSRGVWPQW